MPSTVLNTGASSGIGKTTADRFASEGWNVLATMRSPHDAGDLPNHRVLVRGLNLLDAESIHASVADAIDRFGAIDALVNNAG